MNRQKGTICAVNNKRGTAQSTLCVDNKKDKTELKGIKFENFFLGFHEFRFKSVIPRIPRLFRDRGKSLALPPYAIGIQNNRQVRICFNCCQPSCVQPTAVA